MVKWNYIKNLIKGGWNHLQNSSVRSSIWFHSLLHYIYPYLLKNSNIARRENGFPFKSAIQYFSDLNPYFEKFSISSGGYFTEKDMDRIISYASSLSTMRNRISENFDYQPMQSVFAQLFNQEENKIFTTKLKRLYPSDIMPSLENAPGNVEDLFEDFIKELVLVQEDEQLIYLLEKYFWCVAGTSALDISLYDEMKTTAAIAVSLYDEWMRSGNSLEVFLYNANEDRFILIHGDVSGIQNFIFNIPSKGAAKSLKGRSVYISLLSDVIVRYLIDQLDLYSTNLLYNGGGNFFILAPYHKLAIFENERARILQHLLKAHAGEIYFAMDAVTVKAGNFQDFTLIWDEAKARVNRLKKRKWSEMNLETNFDDIFGPLDEGNEENNICKVCGSFGSLQPIYTKTLEENDIQKCSLCESFIDLTDQLKNAQFIVYEKVSERDIEKYDTYQDIFQHFGFKIRFHANLPGSKKDNEFRYTINDTDFLYKDCSGFHLGAYELPFNEDGQITFEELASRCVKNGRGDKKLAHLKLDVDNLGALFGIGLGERRSISRVSVLSRMLGMFFSGYIHHLIQEKGWQQHLYVVFSGGDDTYLVGTWNEVFLFAKEFYQQFRQFTCENPFITFSAGIRVFHYDYPVIRAADLTEKALDAAKGQGKLINPDLPPVKNKISFMGEVFNWEEFEKIEDLANILEKMVLEYDNRSILQKVKRSTLGFEKILHDSTKGSFRNIKFWRLAYYLREIHHDAVRAKQKGKPKTDYAELIIEEYRKVVIHNIFHAHAKDREQIQKIMIIPAAVKWAEMATRVASVEEDEG